MGVVDPPGFSLMLRRDDYEVVGSTLAQMSALMELLGPMRGGRRYAAYTAWELRWSYDYDRAERGWSVVGVKVVTEVTRTLPRWSTVPSAGEGVVEAWERYLAALVLHEQGHVVIAAAAGRELHEALRGLPRSETREALDALAREAATRITENHRVEDREYDRVTDHGATQGCRLDAIER